MSGAGKVIVVFGMIVLVNLMGSAFPPNSILFSPVVIALSAYLLFGTGYRLATRVGLFCLALVINDLLLKNIAGGTHDVEGAGWINATMILGVFISLIIGLVLFISQKLPAKKIIVALLGITLFSALYINYFAFHGMTITLPSNDIIEEAKKEGNFIRTFSTGRELITNQEDSVVLLAGWLEQEVRVDHTGMIKRSAPTGYVLGSIQTQGNRHGFPVGLYYKVNSKDVNGSGPVDDLIRFRVFEDDSIVELTFFDMRRSVGSRAIIKVISVPLTQDEF